MTIQEQELSELLQALNLKENDVNSSENTYAKLAEKSINSFQEYIDKRNQLSRQDVSGLFAPSWNTALENSLLWIGGCRPSMYIRLTYALCGSQVEFQLLEILQGLARGDLGQISATQLGKINDLHMKTMKEEERLSNNLASLQENIADQPIAVIAKRLCRVGESSGEVDRALDKHESSMANILQEADKLRLSTLKELLGILTPVQGVDFLAANNFCKIRFPWDDPGLCAMDAVARFIPGATCELRNLCLKCSEDGPSPPIVLKSSKRITPRYGPSSLPRSTSRETVVLV
ncbi:Transcription factor TGA like domain - like 4 [Theobroma cacao]|nr:Transcription factor TGA like domain - like 4 [Theobroma cacao]